MWGQVRQDFLVPTLSLCGYSPIVIERGAKMEERHDDILKFWQEGVLKPDSMWRLAREAPVHFGWKIKYQSERQNRKKTVCFTEFFVNFGAPEEILYDAKPHIGTDVLQTVITNMRLAMEEKGLPVFISHENDKNFRRKMDVCVACLHRMEKKKRLFCVSV